MNCKVIVDGWIVSGNIVGIGDNGYFVDTGKYLVSTDRIFKTLSEAIKYQMEVING